MRYQVVFVLRDIAEVVRSQEKMIGRLGTTATDAPAEQVIGLFKKHLAGIQQWLAQQPNFRVLYVQHRELIKNPRPSAERINEFLGGKLDVEKMLACVDPSLHRERAD